VKVEKKEEGQIVFFDYNSFALTSKAKDVLNEKVLPEINANNPTKIKVEGHCDERGSVAYNDKLGKKRADAVKKYLVEKGVKAAKIRTVSYGKSRPLDFGHNEEAWAKNRRAVTISVKK
jgi:peptidoglycan-associated lipoprotein